MEIGNKILELRKKLNLSQEQLAEKVGVTRQTISKWELNETSPDIKQAKELSKIFNISLDELTDNDIKNILESRVSNTEKLAGLILKILKIIGVLFLILLVVDVISLILFSVIRNNKVVENHTTEIELACKLDEDEYLISVGNDGYFNCSNCSEKIQKDLKENYLDYENLDITINNIENYFLNNNGTCE